MARVVTALEARDDIRTLAQPIDNLAFALVTPLGADNYDVGHFCLLNESKPASVYIRSQMRETSNRGLYSRPVNGHSSPGK
jgi:hypothetical protein